MEVLVMCSSNELHSQKLFPSKKIPCLSHFSFFYDVDISTTLISSSEKNEMI